MIGDQQPQRLTEHSAPLGAARAEGTIRNVNTLEAFRNMDKAAMLKRAANTVCCHTVLSRPELETDNVDLERH